MIHKRYVMYVEGYDPQGAEGYYKIFKRSLARFLKYWPLKTILSSLHIDSKFFAHWEIETSGPNWQVHTHYDFLRQEHFIRSNLAESIVQQICHAIRCSIDCFFNGTTFRIFRASWRTGISQVWFQGMIFFWLLISVLGGVFVGFTFIQILSIPKVLSVIPSIITTLVFFQLLRPLLDRWHIFQVNSSCFYLREFSYGKPSCYDEPIDIGAKRIISITRANKVDEVLIIGHSSGGVIAPAVIARALELDPDLGKHGPKVILITLGSCLPGVGMHPKAQKLRAIIGRIVIEPSLLWIDATSRKDVLNFNIDPVASIGIKIDDQQKRHNPLIWNVRFRDSLGDKLYHKLRWNFFIIHYQYIMAGCKRAPYDYFMLVCGPATPFEWINKQYKLLAQFGEDASYDEY